MNDEQFDQELQFLSTLASPPLIEQIRDRDTALREALAQMKTERDQYDELHLESIALAARHEQTLARVETERDSVQIDAMTYAEQRDNLREALARVEAERDSVMDTYVALAEKLGIDLDAARKAQGKPSDVFVSYISGIQAQLAEAVERLAKAEETIARLQSGAVT